MITSLTNSKIKELVKLNQAKNREAYGKFIVEGPHLVEEAQMAGVLLETYTTDERYSGELLSEAVMKKITNTVHPVKVIGVCAINRAQVVTDKVLVLDNIQDPTNLGTILRTAKAFGFNTVFASNDTVDFYNDKVIRGSQGAIFKLNLLKGNILEFLGDLQNTHTIYGTDVRNGQDATQIAYSPKLCLVLGNEARGVSSDVKSLCKHNLYIPLEQMESLNVSIAGAILMYEIKKRV